MADVFLLEHDSNHNNSSVRSVSDDDFVTTEEPSVHATKPLLVTDPLMAYVYIGLMCVALLVGSVGNVLIVLVIGIVRTVQRTGKIFIINLALADLCVASFADPMCVVAVVKGQGWFNDKMWLCEMIASLCLTSCFCAFLSLSMATFNRYVFICHNLLYDKIFTRQICVGACVIIWLVAFLFEFPNFLGWGGHYYDQKNHQCIWDRTASFSYTMLVSSGLIGGPLGLMLVCNILIFRHIYRTKLTLYGFGENDVTRNKKIWQETLRTSRMLLGIFIVFVVCWTPYAIVIVLDFYSHLSVEVHLFVTMLAHLHSSSNCAVYIFTNRSFRLGVLRALGCSKFMERAASGESGTKSWDGIAKISTTHATLTSCNSNSSNSSG